MAWESALDRLILRQIHQAEEGRLKDAEVSALITDLCAFGADRPQTWFHCGYGRTLLGLDLPEPGDGAGTAHRRWFAFGRVKGHIRRSETGWLADLTEDSDLMLDLLTEPGIAAQVLPAMIRAYFREGCFESAVRALEVMDARIGATEDPDELPLLVDAALIDLLARIERGRIPPEETGSLRRALDRAMAVERFQHLGPADRARFHRALGQSHLSSGEWEEAAACLQRAADLCAPDSEVHRSVHLLLALTRLRILDLGQLEPEAEREGRDDASKLLDIAAAEPSPLPGALHARGILAYETGCFEAATAAFDEAVRKLLQEPSPDDVLFARARFFLGASLLAGGVREESRRAAHLIDETLDRVEPDLQTFYGVYDPLKETDPKVALRFLDQADVGRGVSPENLLLIGLEYQSLGEPARALAAAERVLQVATDLDQRLDALKVRLCAHNMQGRRDEARTDYFEIRELLMQRGAFEELAKTLKDEALVGQALDHLEIKSELVSLYEEMDGMEWECANLKLQMARTFRARKEVEDLRQAQGILQEVAIQFPEFAAEDLQNLEKLLALRADEDPATTSPMDAFAAQLGHRPRFLIVGGNERQRKHHPRLEALASEWNFEAEWMMANYSSPQKLVNQIAERLARDTDVLILLHWNRHETTEPALEKARLLGIPARTLFYAGFTSLQVCLEEMAGKLAGAVARG